MQRIGRVVTMNVVFPVAAGALIYLSWRSSTLLVFHWAEALGASRLLEGWRLAIAPLGKFMPQWVLYSLPDALWVYALTASMSLVWWDSRSKLATRLWIPSGAVLGCGGEVCQRLGLLPGTFDLADLLLSAAAALAAYGSVRMHKEKPWIVVVPSRVR